MTDNICVIIPARSGSKGIIDKNIANLGNFNLLVWAIKIAQNVERINPDNIFVSTDSNDYGMIAEHSGAKALKRPSRYAEDKSTVTSFLNYHFKQPEFTKKRYKTMVYLEPTSPFRTPTEISAAIDALNNCDFDSCASFAESSVSPYNILELNRDRSLNYLQENGVDKKAYHITGAVYTFNIDTYLKLAPSSIYFGKKTHIIQESPDVDIDHNIDLHKARSIAANLVGTYWNEIGLC